MKSYTVCRASVPEWGLVPEIEVNTPLWLQNPDIRMTAQLCHDGDNIFVRLRAWEENIRAELNAPDSPVCEDSCMEFFFSPDPAEGGYFNVEINPNGCFFLGFGHGRHDLCRLFPENGTALFNIKTAHHADGWEVSYRIPIAFIRKYYPDFEASQGRKMRANFYKCGDKCKKPHYLSWNPVTSETPDFHRPCDFGDVFFG